MRFVLARHGTTDWNEQHRMQGRTNTNLNEKGLEEAQELAKQLKGLGITKIISSTLNRALQTATLINVELNVDKDLDARLMECAFGAIEGLTLKEAEQQYGDVLTDDDLYDCRAYDYRSVGGEDFFMVIKRILQVLEECKKEFIEDDVVLLVGHGWIFCSLLTVLGQENPRMQRGEYKIIEY